MKSNSIVVTLEATYSKLIELEKKMMDKDVKVYFEKLKDDIKLPEYANDGDAGMDVFCPEDYRFVSGDTYVVPLGFKVAIPVGYEIQVRPRSGMSLKTKIRVANSPGTIDCLSGDTIIPLLDGRSLPLKELNDLSKKDLWVYSIDSEGYIRPGKITKSWLVGQRKIFRVSLDSGGYIDCTADHKIRLIDGTYKKVSDLLQGDSLCPLDRRYDKDGYEIFKSISKEQMGRWVSTHRMVASEFEDICGMVVHHKDENIKNNLPSNLKAMTHKEHFTIHPSKSKMHEWGLTKEGKAHRSNFGNRVSDNSNRINAIKNSEKLKSTASSNITVWNKSNDGRNTARSTIYRTRRGYIIDILKRMINNEIEITESNYEKEKLLYLAEINSNFRIPNYKNLDNYGGLNSLLQEAVNCKVVDVSFVGIGDVYDITIDKYHNFVANNVFVHNCGYRGEVGVILDYIGVSPWDSYQIKKGDKIAQLVLKQVERCNWEIVRSVDDVGTDRGGGFGSTGV